MSNSTGMGRTAGRFASLICAAGVIAFFVGIFGGPRTFAFVGVALMAVSMIGFYVEEHIERRN